MQTIDLYFQTTDREAFEAALITHDLAAIAHHHLVDPPRPVLVLAEGVAVDYIGPIASAPAVWDYEQSPPVEITSATMLPGEYAALRLTGPQAQERAATIAAAELSGVVLLTAADVPAAALRWAGGSTPYTAPAEIPPPPPVPELPLATQKQRLLDRLAQRRWEVETGGVTLHGLTLLTDDRSKLLLLGAADQARRDPEFHARWKTPEGWLDLGAPTIIAAAEAVLAHTQSAFAREAELSAQIADAADAETLTPLRAAVEAFWHHA